MLSPRSEALAFRIWVVCQPSGWDMTRAEVAEALGVEVARVNNVANRKGWADRFRCSERRLGGAAYGRDSYLGYSAYKFLSELSTRGSA